MSTTSATDRALLLRHLAALRRAGVPATSGLRQVVAALPSGGLRDRLSAAADALDRGESGEDLSDPLVAIVARGEAAIPDVLEAAAASYEFEAATAELVGRAAGRLVLVLTVMGAVCVAMYPVSAEFLDLWGRNTLTLPVPTAFVLGNRALFLVFGVLALAGAGLLLLRPDLVARRLGGWLRVGDTTKLGLAAAASGAGLDEASALVAAGLPAQARESFASLGLAQVDTAAVEWVRATQGFTRAMTFAATAGAIEGRVQQRWLLVFAETGALMLVGLLVGLSLVAFYLPIFVVTGSLS